MTQVELKKKSRFDKFLNWVEKVGNKLPEPLLLFAGLSVVVVLLSYVFSLLGFSDIHPVTKEPLYVVNLLSVSGLQRILSNAVNNFLSFPPLGIVLTCMLGVGLCEKSGLFSALLRNSLSGLKGSSVKVVVF
jgi:aminobenzoyl-glutamate transport protein